MHICAACEKPFEAEGRVHTCPECVKLVQEGEKPKFNDAKQVILIRKDLGMPAGKIGAQVAHASVACLLQMGRWIQHNEGPFPDFKIDMTEEAVYNWMTKSFPKITLEVKNEAQLKRYYDEAVAAGLPASWIVDAGRTVFNGVPTPTCVGIGPASREAIDAITKRLRVYQ